MTIKCEHTAILPPGYDERTRIAVVSPGGRVVIAHPDRPVLYLHEGNWFQPPDPAAQVFLDAISK